MLSRKSAILGVIGQIWDEEDEGKGDTEEDKENKGDEENKEEEEDEGNDEVKGNMEHKEREEHKEKEEEVEEEEEKEDKGLTGSNGSMNQTLYNHFVLLMLGGQDFCSQAKPEM